MNAKASTPVRLAKTQRQHLISRVLGDQAVSSQEQLVSLLESQGVVATQATVSRDLEDLGAVKVRMGGGDVVYAIPQLPRDQRVPEDLLRRTFADHVVEVSHSANIVVVRTPPGNASVVAAALDRSAHPDVVGTVAGDDTIFVVASEGTTGKAVAEAFRGLAGLS
ncbi:MAG: arginine repressor [Acidimicrobiales bacterium]|nr:arginine repressor [Acidimicrobiales bacterium]